MIGTLSILVTVITVAWWYFCVQKRANLPSGPINLPIIGALYLFLGKNKRPCEVLTGLSRKYGGIFGLQMGSIYTVVLSDPALIRDAFRRDEFTGRAPLFLTHGIMNGYGLICAEGPMWRDQRKCTISWLRHLGMVKVAGDKRLQLEQRIMCHVRQAVWNIKDHCKNHPSTALDLQPIITNNLGNVINDIVFGVVYSANDPTWTYLQELQTEGIEYMGVAGPVNFFPILRFLPKNRKIMNFILEGKEKSHQIYTKIVRSAKTRLQARNYELQEPTNILELFLKERYTRARASAASSSADDPEFGDCQLNHLLADLFGAGLDTTAATLRWLLLYVALSPPIQEKLYREMAETLPADAVDVSLEYYDSLPYLRACIAEAQRIRPVVTMGIPHGTTAATDLAHFRIPRGTMVIPLQWAVHMNPDEWPEPDLFKPERFYDEHSNTFSTANRPHFMPFQTGKRMCLGDDLGKMLLFLLAGNLLRHFQLRLPGRMPPPDREALLRGVDGLTLTPPPHKFRIVERRLASEEEEEEVVADGN